MFADPITMSIDTETITLPRVSTGDMQSRYRSADGKFELEIAHSANKRERTLVKVRTNTIGSDPFNAERSRSYTAFAHLVIDAPLNGVGFTDADQKALIDGLLGFLSESENLLKILGKES